VGHTLFLAASMMIGPWPALATCLPVDDFARQLAGNSPSRRGQKRLPELSGGDAFQV